MAMLELSFRPAPQRAYSGSGNEVNHYPSMGGNRKTAADRGVGEIGFHGRWYARWLHRYPSLLSRLYSRDAADRDAKKEAVILQELRA
jgi:hypothetical protein